MAGVVTTINSFKLPSTETFRTLAWDVDNKGIELDNISVLALFKVEEELGLNDNRLYCKFGDTHVFWQSVLLNPVVTFKHFDDICNAFNEYCKRNGISLNTLYGMKFYDVRILMNMKLRGNFSAGSALFSDKENNTRILPYAIPNSSLGPPVISTNENMVFEFDMVEGNVRNFFYNASRREFVHSKKPSWR